MIDFTVCTLQDLEDAVKKFGILPLFKNPIPGFSVEEHVSPELWFGDQEGVWEWKGPVIRDTGCAYGKFLGGRAVFISREWFPDFANWRRDGYDYDARYEDELASYKDKVFFDLLEAKAPVLSGDLKKAGNYGKEGNKGFDTILNRLQAQCYVLTSDFVYKVDKHGKPYGWGVAQYSTPEKFMGLEFTDRVYDKKPEASYELIRDHLQELFPECDRKTIERYLTTYDGGDREEGVKAWLVPSNYHYFNVIEAFHQNEIIHWKQGNDRMKVGDIVFLYVGQPFSAILFRCEIVEADIPYTGDPGGAVNFKKLMRIRRLEEYPKEYLDLPRLKKYDVVTVRAARSMPPKLLAAIETGNLVTVQ